MNFSQEFRQLLKTSPRYNLRVHANSINSDYVDGGSFNKNVYYCFESGSCVDTLYSVWARDSRDMGDCAYCYESELCYECVDCLQCYDCNFLQDCELCSSCSYGYNLKNCTNCFGCVNLRNKEYYIFNTSCSKNDYKNQVAALKKTPETIHEKTKHLRATLPVIATHYTHTEACLGNYITASKNCFHCFDTLKGEDCCYGYDLAMVKDCVDASVGGKAELSYDFLFSSRLYNSNFILDSTFLSDCEFCAFCFNCKHCFGCAYLKDKEYHILNKPYTKEEYANNVITIKKDLRKKNLYSLDILMT